MDSIEICVHGLRVQEHLDKLFFQHIAPHCGRIKLMRFVGDDFKVDGSPMLVFIQFYDRFTLDKQKVVIKPTDPIEYYVEKVISYININLFLKRFRLMGMQETARQNNPFVADWPDTAIFLKTRQSQNNCLR